jgi:ComF family protein
MNLIDDFMALLFPAACNGCGKILLKNEEIICTSCLFHLPKTDFHKYSDNPVAGIFRGRVPVEAATSGFLYKKGGTIQHMIHRMKYKGIKEIGVWFGEMYGAVLVKEPVYASVSSIIPIPLHKRKLRKRGFNQAELFARGLSKSMNIPLDLQSVIRILETSTQTKKTRYKRWGNVNEIFRVVNPEKLKGQHILLVDDVITTGATMESCMQTILQTGDIKISAASIAFAMH